jgi:hypothetical protein
MGERVAPPSGPDGADPDAAGAGGGGVGAPCGAGVSSPAPQAMARASPNRMRWGAGRRDGPEDTLA